MTHLKVGGPIPEFKAKDQNGEVFSSGEMKGRKWVLYFYPRDLTPACTVQACNLRDNYQTLRDQGIDVVGVSMDQEQKHQRFIFKYKLPFTLLADADKKVIGAFGVWGEKKFMGRVYDGIHRTSFLIDEKGKIAGIIERPKTKNHAEEILQLFANTKS